MTLTAYRLWLWLCVSKPLPRWAHLLLWVSLPYVVVLTV